MKLLIVEVEENLGRSILQYCVLLDLGLPDGAGLELLRHLKKLSHHLWYWV